jgi:soluble lytic murein transglycosylase-like protein
VPCRHRFVIGLVVAGASIAAAAVPAHADVVRLANGRTMRVEHCRFEGQVAVLVMKGGGQVRTPRDLVVELLPDEAPFARQTALELLDASPTAAGPRPSPHAIRLLVDRVAARVGLDARLAHAVIRAESNYGVLAISPKGAMGLMQIMPALANEYGLSDPFDPEQNLEAGMRHLRRLLRRLDVRRALAAYNAGEGAVSRYGGIPPYRETQRYVNRILVDLRQ